MQHTHRDQIGVVPAPCLKCQRNGRKWSTVDDQLLLPPHISIKVCYGAVARSTYILDVEEGGRGDVQWRFPGSGLWSAARPNSRDPRKALCSKCSKLAVLDTFSNNFLTLPITDEEKGIAPPRPDEGRRSSAGTKGRGSGSKGGGRNSRGSEGGEGSGELFSGFNFGEGGTGLASITEQEQQGGGGQGEGGSSGPPGAAR